MVFCLGVAAAWLAVGRALAPLRAMGETAGRIDERALGVRVPVPPTGDELAGLGESLNAVLDRLEQAFTRERAFIADASHELLTPVSILLTTLEVTQSRPRTSAEYGETMDTLTQTTRRMRGIVESLLTLARADAGRLTVHREAVDVGLARLHGGTIAVESESGKGTTFRVSLPAPSKAEGPVVAARSAPATVSS